MTADTTEKRTTEKRVVIFHLRTTWFMCEIYVSYLFNICTT